jgi:hypothetical protein
MGHEADMPTALRNVRCWMNSGKYMLALSLSGFDPSRTLGLTSVQGGFCPLSLIEFGVAIDASRAIGHPGCCYTVNPLFNGQDREIAAALADFLGIQMPHATISSPS